MANCFARTNGSRASWEIGSSSSSLIATTELKINLYPISYFWNQWWSSLLVCQADHNIQVGFLPFLSTQLLEKTAPWAEKNSIRYASRFPIQNGILKYPVDFHLAMPQKRGKKCGEVWLEFDERGDHHQMWCKYLCTLISNFESKDTLS